MTKPKGFGRHVWKIMMVLSIIFIVLTLFILSRGSNILPTAFKLAGSSQLTEDIEKNALAFINMSMLKPLWEEIWIGIFGILIALGLRGLKRFAWILGIFWAIMMLANGVIQGGYEILVLGWSMICFQTYAFLLPGAIALISLLATKKDFSMANI